MKLLKTIDIGLKNDEIINWNAEKVEQRPTNGTN